MAFFLFLNGVQIGGVQRNAQRRAQADAAFGVLFDGEQQEFPSIG
jgi:hypothetical protein